MRKALILLCILSVIAFSFGLIIIIADNDNTNSVEKDYTVSGLRSEISIDSLIGKDYLIDSQHSYIGFKINYFGYSPVRGRFNDFEGTIFYDKNQLESFYISVVIDVNTINTGNSERDLDLINGQDWFNAKKYPSILFNSTKTIRTENEGFIVNGVIEIKGIKKNIDIKFNKPTKISRDYAKNEQVDYKGSLILKRSDFGVTGEGFWNSIMENGIMQLSNDVEIEIEIHTRRGDYLERLKAYKAQNIRKRILDTILIRGIDKGIRDIEAGFRENELSAGGLSTIGKTLNALEKHDFAKKVFEKKKELFPDKLSTFNQLGVTELFLNNREDAIKNFEALLRKDSLNTRAKSYLNMFRK